MAAPRALILRAPGANCDREAQFAAERAGAAAERVHVNRLREQPGLLRRYQVLVIPGGFTYGDDVAAGKILANQLAHFLGDALRQFRDADKLILDYTRLANNARQAEITQQISEIVGGADALVSAK